MSEESCQESGTPPNSVWGTERVSRTMVPRPVAAATLPSRIILFLIRVQLIFVFVAIKIHGIDTHCQKFNSLDVVFVFSRPNIAFQDHLRAPVADLRVHVDTSKLF